METSTIIELISTVGFPIVVALALGFFVYKLWQQSVTREEKLFEEITESRTINSKFAEIIGQYEITLGEIKEDVRDIKTDINTIKNITHTN